MDFICPLCRGPLHFESPAYICDRDRRSYPTILGIPDFRIFPNGAMQPEKEQALIACLVEEYSRRSFSELAECFDSLLPAQPQSMRTKHKIHRQTGTVRGTHSLAEIQHYTTLAARNRFLEIGCGTGAFLLAASAIFQTVVGLDINIPRLILAKKRLEEAGQPVFLFCACAESLPFPDRSFQCVVGSDVIEHVNDQVQVMGEAFRVLVPEGAVFLATPNRWSLTPEPHVNVWGVGFLPKGWRGRYVELVRHVPYRGITLLNWFEVRRLLRRTQFMRWHIFLPSFPPEHTERLPVWARAAMPLYEVLKDHPLTKWLVCLFGPSFHVVCIKG